MALIRKYCENDGVLVFDSHLDSRLSSYDSHHLDSLTNAENSHFWFSSRSDVICRQFQQHVEKTNRILEIGGGTGFVAKKLIDLGYRMEMADIHSNGLEQAKKRGIEKLYQFDLFHPPFREEFDTVCLFDVLEHLRDEEKALECIKILLKPGGTIVLTVPAHQWLWSREDVIAGHYRRYTKNRLEALLRSCGLETIDIRYFFSALVPFFLLRKILKRDTGRPIGQNEKISLAIPSAVNKAFSLLMKSELFLSRWLPAKVGGSLIAIARLKP